MVFNRRYTIPRYLKNQNFKNIVKPLNSGHTWSPTFRPLLRGGTFLKFIKQQNSGS